MKKALATALSALMLLSLVACGGGSGSSTPAADAGDAASTPAEAAPAESEAAGAGNELAGTYDITVWVPEAAVELTKTQISDFNSSNEFGITFNATVEPVSEADAANNVVNDVSAAGDIFFFAQDQLARMIQAGSVNPLGQGAAETVRANSEDVGIVAATSGSDLYAYPLTSDNGYFMYYDKSVIPEEDIDSLEAILADCEENNKLFAMEYNTSAWYTVSWFFATGCHSNWTFDDAGNATALDDDFNSPNGVIAAKGMQKLLNSKAKLSSSSVAEFSNGAAVVISGTWGYTDALAILGDNLGAADLPSFEVDGQEYHMGSYNGCKLLGVKPQEDAVRAAALNQLALYLTNQECQLARFNELAWGPADKAAHADPAVQANSAQMAITAQYPYSTMQPNINGAWWDVAKVIGDDLATASDDAAIQAALEKYESAAQATIAS